MSVSPEIIVVGAGIVGAACALDLTREGLRTTVIEEGAPGAGTTAAAMGHIVVMDDSEAQFALTRYSQILWDELRGELPLNVEFENCGTIWVAADDEEMAEVRRKADYYQERGVRAEILSPASLREAEPHLRPGLAGGLLVQGDGVLYPPCAAAFLLHRAQELGAKVLLGKKVTNVGKGAVRLADGSALKANIVINATGQLAPRLTPGLNIRPRKGHLVITDRYPGTVRHQLVELGYLKSAHSLSSDSVAFNVQPRKTGQLLIGSSRQYGDENRAVDANILSRMLRRAFEYVPGLKGISGTRVWAGFRPATPDKLPLIGPAASDPSIYIAAGHEGLGITTSLGTARLVTAQILGQRPAIPMEPYLPTREMAVEHHNA
ncbi:MAG TPA: FAD-dependent oxidoreductase [Candidatus Acidoferrales bacterium]|nr:FAD-dependent oxidoreductase [Candidatus Acidoferrales bacterium]